MPIATSARQVRHALAPVFAGAAVLLLMLGIRAADPAVLADLRYGVFDSYQRLAPRPYRPVPVRVVDIDDESLARVGQWPWSRRTVGALVDRLTAAGAAAVAFDIVFAEPDRTSPARLIPTWTDIPSLAPLAELAVDLPDFDADFARALAGSPSVLGFALTATPNEFRPQGKAGLAVVGPDPAAALPAFSGAVVNLPALEAAARGQGSFAITAERDGVIRRLPLLQVLDGTVHPGLALEALRVAQGADTIQVKTTADGPGGAVAVDMIRVGRVTIPATADGRMWLRFTEIVPDRSLPAWRVLADDAGSEGSIAGTIVLVGTSAAGLKDLRTTPLAAFEPGALIMAQGIEQMLTGTHLDRPDWASGAEIVLALVLGALVILVLPRVSPVGAAAIAALLCGLVATGGWLAFARAGLLLDSVYPMLSTLAAAIAVGFTAYWRTERDRRWIRQAFASYVSPNLVDHLVARPDSLRLGGERRVCSFVLTDIAGFTALVEGQPPERLVALVNAYLAEMLAIAFRHDGTIDRIVGDSVAVMFAAPVDQPDHAARAVACAIAMDVFARQFAAEQRAAGLAVGDTRIGVHTGPVIVGNFGGAGRLDYRALGDPINTASRLESANRHLGTRLCVSGDTVAACPDFTGRPIGRLMLVGKSEPVMAWEPLLPAEAARPTMQAYAEAYSLLDAGDTAAPAAFAALHAQAPDDPLIALHDDRLRRGESGTLVVLGAK